jgi:hypothetical protein
MAVSPAAGSYFGTSNAQGLFADVSSSGLVQGTAYPDPATRYQLRTGWLASTETIPMWGGVGIYENIPGVTGGPVKSLGVQVGRATGLTGTYPLAGFSVFDQAYGMVNSPSSPVPTAGSYMQVPSYRLDSGARIAVACDPALASLYGSKISSQVSWDFVNQLLVPYIGTLTISSGTYNNTTGLVTLTMSTSVTFSAGDSIVVSSLTGTGAYASLDGTFTALSATGTTVTYNPGAGLGASTITGGSLTLGSGASSALPCSVLDIQVGNSMIVAYSNGLATWNYSGSCAVIQI